ncbi:MAG: HEAT repeat domain-containing protein [Blastocatellia bacterium]|nr:HEAT repeat domain-containing protein [Blastocatellia bacterium]
MTIRSLLNSSLCLVLVSAPAAAQKPTGTSGQRPAVVKPAAENPDLKESEAILRRLVELDRLAAKKSFAELLEDTANADQQLRLAAIRALRGHFSETTQAEAEKKLLALGQDASWMVRGEAVFSLGFSKPGEPLVTALRQSLKDDHWFVRGRAVQALGKLKATDAVPDLVALYETEGWDNRARIAFALGEIGDLQALDTLLAAMASDDGTLQLIAYGALKNFRGGRTLRALLSRLNVEKTPGGKLLLVRAVGALQLKQGRDKIESWRSESPELDREITLALYRLGEAEALSSIIRDFTLYPKAVQLEILKDWQTKNEARAVPLLLTLLVNGPPEQRKLAATTIENIQENLPLQPVLDAITDTDAETRDILVRVLKKGHDPALPVAIITRLKAEPPRPEREALLSLLEDFKTPETVSALLAIRLDDKQRARLGVAAALEKFNISLEGLAAQAADNKLPVAERIQATAWLGELGEPAVIPKLALLLETDDAKQRVAVVEALGHINDRTAIEPLIRSLDDRDPAVRTAASAALLRFGIAPERLTSDLAAKEWQIRIEALKLLSRMGNTSQIPAMVELLRDSEPQVRRAAVEALKSLKDTRAVEGLMTALRDNDIGVRAGAAEALGEIGDARATQPLLTALRNSANTSISTEIATALAKLKSNQAVPLLLDGLRNPSWTVRAQIARVLGEFQDTRAVPPLVEALEDNSAVVRYYARQSLAHIGVSSPEGLLRLFTKNEGRARYGSMEVIRLTHLTATVPTLLTALSDVRLPIRAMAAYVLGNLKDEKAIPALAQALEIEDRFTVRWWLAYALGNSGEPARPILLKLANHKKPRVRQDALRALGFLPPDEAAHTVLLAALQDKDDTTRGAAVEALGRSQDTAAIGVLTGFLKSPNHAEAPVERPRPDLVITALFQMGTPGKKALLESAPQLDAGVRSQVLHVLGADGDPEMLPLLLEAARSGPVRVRLTALQELARQSDEKALEALIFALSDQQPEIRLEAVRWLTLIGGPESIAALKTQFDKETVPDIRTLMDQAIKQLKQ